MGMSLPKGVQENFQNNIASILQEKLLDPLPSLQEKILHYFQKQGAFHSKLLQQYPAEDWIYMLFHGLLIKSRNGRDSLCMFWCVSSKGQSTIPVRCTHRCIIMHAINQKEHYAHSPEALCIVLFRLEFTRWPSPLIAIDPTTKIPKGLAIC